MGFEDSLDQKGFKDSVDNIACKLKKHEHELVKRDVERLAELEKKREERDQSTASNEKFDFFIDTFNEKKEEIEKAINAATSGSVEKSRLTFHFDTIAKHIQSLQNYISASRYFLREYDLRKSKDAIQELHQRCQELEERLIPKKKFRFKVRKTPVSGKEAFASKIEDCVDSSAVQETHLSKPRMLVESICGFTQKVSENLIMNHEGMWKKDVTLSHLENCSTVLKGVPSTLHVSKLQSCRVLCGPVVTSIFIEDCLDCIFVLAGQQMRIHNTHHCDFYIHVTSKAIIEDSKEVRFAPYNWRYCEIERHFQLAELDMNRNNWDIIDDFNWLASDKPSPNWRVIKDNEQIKDWPVV